ncbi:MAG: alginate export family protein [bacterium]|nr:alginate export family protein [bacterium]
MRRKSLLCLWIAICFTGLLAGTAVGGDSLVDAVKDGEVIIDIRYRFEVVDQDSFDDDAQASTLRGRLGYRTGSYHNFFALAEFEGIAALGGEKYNDTPGVPSDVPVIADPEDEELNRLFLGYKAGKTKFKLGRQRIKLDNDRFIGNVGWRQNEQTFDAFSVTSKFVDNLTAFYGHLNNANRIFGEHHPTLSDLDLSSDLLNLSYGFDFGTLTAYGYFIEIEDSPDASHRNLGLRFKGKAELSDDLDLAYTVEYADQADYKDGLSSVDADYLFGHLGFIWDKFNVKVGYEVLGGDGDYGFQTPLATLHAFNGWADKFLVTPDTGLQDMFVSFGTKWNKYNFMAIYHNFTADEGSDDYGTEIGVKVSRKFGDHCGVLLKYAKYDADDFSDDTDKLWVDLKFKL